jgi:hypothetical protein
MVVAANGLRTEEETEGLDRIPVHLEQLQSCRITVVSYIIFYPDS